MESALKPSARASAILSALLLSTSLWLSAEPPGHKFAVVVGIDHYSSPHWHSLSYAEADASAVASKLKAQGFQVTELHSLKARKQDILEALYQTASILGPDDSVFFFFAGHGASEHVGSETFGYLVPSDGTNSSSYISNDDLQSISRRMHAARHQLFILDACYSGLMLTRSGGVDPSISNYIEEIQSRTSREVLTAGGGNQEVLDSGKDGHSVFTSALLRGLAGEADFNKDGFITFPELEAYIAPMASNAYQTPSAGVLPGHAGGDFVFLSPLGRTAASAASALPSTIVRRGGEGEADLSSASETISSMKAGTDELANARELLATSRFSEAFVAFSNAAKSGNPDAMFNVGQIYEKGWGVLQDYAQAREWYEKAVDAGNADAAIKMGDLYVDGRGLSPDLTQARLWYEKGATARNPRAMNNLGIMYLNGIGVPRDCDKALHWFEQGAAVGNPKSMANLGYVYLEGLGVEKDYTLARQWYEKAAAQGDWNALAEVGAFYANGYGVVWDPVQARQLWEKAAAAGSSTGELDLGLMYYQGKGVVKDLVQARQWWEKAAAGGNSDAMTSLGVAYQMESKMPQDFVLARQWYEKAAAAGDATAMYNIGFMYENGIGIERDFTLAKQWYEKAAAAGIGIAMSHLGFMYEDGKGVERDIAAARR